MTLNTAPAAMDLDAMYERLIAAHAGLSEAQSHALNARLVLLLANHIGDMAVLQQAFDAARHGLGTIAPVAPSHVRPQ